MLKTQNIFSTKFKNTSSIFKFKKSWPKKFFTGFLLITAAVTALEFSTMNSTAIKYDNIVSYKVNLYNSLINYNNFKTQINNFKYTDDDFKKDMITFKYIYEHNDNKAYKEVIKYNTVNYASGLASIVANSDRYVDINTTYKNTLIKTQNIKLEDIVESSMRDSVGIHYRFKSEIYDLLKTDESIKYSKDRMKQNKIISSSFRLGNNYANYDKALSADGRIYDNLQKLLKEKGYNENLLVLPYSFVSTKNAAYNTGKSEQDRYFNTVKTYQNNSDKILLSYYQSGNMEKLRELFKINRAFKYLMVDKSIEDNVKDINSLYNDYTISAIASYKLNTGLYENIIYDISKFKGDVSPEKSPYYEDSLGIFY